MGGLELGFRFLGHFAIGANGQWHDGPPPKRGRELLQYLGAHPRRMATCDELAWAFWPGVEPDCVAHRIHLAASGARTFVKAILSGRDIIRRVPGGYVWDQGISISSDVDELLRLCRSHTDVDLKAALAIYDGEFLAGETADWLQPLRIRCSTAYASAVERLAERAKHDGNYAEALAYGLQLIDFEPAHEAATRLVMSCFAALGQRGRAMECYSALQRYLHRNLGIEPTRETVALAIQVRNGELVERFESDGRGAVL